MKIKLTESELTRIVRKALKEEQETAKGPIGDCFREYELTPPQACKSLAMKIVKDSFPTALGRQCLKELVVLGLEDPLGYKKGMVTACIIKKFGNL